VSATAERPDDGDRRPGILGGPVGVPLRPVLASDFTIQDGNGNRKRWVRNGPESIRAKRALACHIFGCPDEWLDETIAVALKRIE
jgi:hypothetical protein